MVTKTITVKGGEFAVEPDGRLRPIETYYVNSTDAKPTEGVRDADRCVEKDTCKMFIYDEDKAAANNGDGWIPFSKA